MSSSNNEKPKIRGGALKLKTPLNVSKVAGKPSSVSSTASVSTSYDQNQSNTTTLVGVKRTREGPDSSSTIILPTMTKSEKALHEAQVKRTQEQIRLLSAKSHKEKIAQFNERLAKAPEHNDLFKISYAGTG